MAPKLYSILPSPPVRAVLMCAKVLGVELELVPVDLLALDHLNEDFREKNPQHTVPLLEEEDGFLIADSHAIMAYLVAQYGKDDSLYPKNDNRLRATIDRKLHFDSGILFARGLQISKPLIFLKRIPSHEKIDELKEAFQFLDQMLEISQTEYVAGNTLSIADFSIVTSVTSWDVFTPYSEFTNLKAYIERFQELPCYEANEEGLKIYKEIIAEEWGKLKSKQ